MDVIKIRDLEIYGHHGVMKEENVLGQKFLVSLALYTDTRAAGESDNLADSVNYAEVSYLVKEQMEKETYRLIEAAAEQLAKKILLKFPLVKKVEVEIKKPWAPILLPLDTVSVSITRGWETAYLSIGSNMGDRKAYLEAAIEELKKVETIREIKVSEIIETEPYGYTDQDKFLNAAIGFETLLTPEALLSVCHEIEKKGNRERKIHWGPRTIDLDILLYGDCVMHTETLTIPHSEMHKRQFVLEPLSEIAPYVKSMSVRSVSCSVRLCPSAENTSMVFCRIRMISRILKKQKKRLIKNRQKYIILACRAPIHSRRWKTCLVRRYRGSAVRVFRA